MRTSTPPSSVQVFWGRFWSLRQPRQSCLASQRLLGALGPCSWGPAGPPAACTKRPSAAGGLHGPWAGQPRLLLVLFTAPGHSMLTLPGEKQGKNGNTWSALTPAAARLSEISSRSLPHYRMQMNLILLRTGLFDLNGCRDRIYYTLLPFSRN